MKSVTNKILKKLKEYGFEMTIDGNNIFIHNLLLDDIGININVVISNFKIKDDIYRLDFLAGPITHVVNYDSMINAVHSLNNETVFSIFSINDNNDLIFQLHNLSREDTIAEDADFLFLIIYRQIIEIYPKIMKANWQ